MSDINPSSQLPIKITDNTNTVAITGASALRVDGSGVTQPISGTVSIIPTGSQQVSGTVVVQQPTAAALNATVVGTVTAIGTITTIPSGTQTIIPSGTQTIAGSITVVQATASNLNAAVVGVGTAGTASGGVLSVQGVASMTPLLVNGSGVTQPVSGTITAVPTGTYTTAPTGTQTVQGSITSIPSGTQPVSGTITAVASGTQPVSGTVTSMPSGTQPVSGTVTSIPSGTQPVSGTVTTVGTSTATVAETTTGVVVNYATTTNVAAASVGVISYTVTAGKTLVLKGVCASSSGAPCKVQVDTTTGTFAPAVLATGFYSAANPFLLIPFLQAPPIAASTVVNVRVTNLAGAAQDLYSTIMGHEV